MSAPPHTPEVLPLAANDEELDNDFDSTFGEGAESTTTSISSTILNYRELHGRTYHAQVGNTEYWGPNDDIQNENLDIGHHMLTLLLEGKLYLAPISSNVQNVVDIGTGTGIWAIDFADAHPQATIVGTDISPIQPNFVPPNLRFEIDDAQLEWTWPDSHFDFIHLRCMMGSIDNWPLLYERAFRCTKPGGWIEHVDFDIQFTSDDGTVKPGDIMYDWTKPFFDSGETLTGRTFYIPRRARELMEKAGYVDLVEKKYKLPIGPWMDDPRMKEIGNFNRLFMLTGLDGFTLYTLKNVLGWSFEEVQVHTAEIRAALINKKLHGYYTVVLVYGRKPELEPSL